MPSVDKDHSHHQPTAPIMTRFFAILLHFLVPDFLTYFRSFLGADNNWRNFVLLLKANLENFHPIFFACVRIMLEQRMLFSLLFFFSLAVKN